MGIVQGRRRAMRVFVLVALAAVVVVAHASAEVEALEEGVVMGGGADPKDGAEGGGSVLDLTKGIKQLQSDISNIREKKAGASDTAKSTATDAAQAAEGGAKDKAVKGHIDAATDEQDLDAQQKQKEKELVQATIEQHEAAKSNAVEARGADGAKVTEKDSSDGSSDGSDSSGDDSSVGGDDDSDGGSDDAAGGYGGDEGGGDAAVFDQFQSAYDSAHGALSTQAKNVVKAMVEGENAVVKKIEAQKQVVHTHIEKARKAYQKETSLRKKAQAKAKEFGGREKTAKASEKKAKETEKATKKNMQEALEKAKERRTKAVEKKQKAVDTEERKKKTFEKRVKELEGRKIPDCGAIKEKEMKAKEEIKKLQAEDKKIRDDCEKKAKEMAKKASERLTKSKEKTTKQKERADKLAAELTAAKE